MGDGGSEELADVTQVGKVHRDTLFLSQAECLSRALESYWLLLSR